MIDQRELFELATACLDGTASEDQQTRLAELICHDPAVKLQYIQFMADTWILRGLAKQPDVRGEGTGARGEGSAGEEALSGTALAAGDSPSPFRIPNSAFRISALAALVAFMAIGILAYSFWPGPTELPVVKQTPAAKIANLTDAKWAGVSSQAGDTLIAGQQLLLQSGSAEITFNDQARVIVDGPAELTIVDAAACRLATGRLTAHVPEPAKGFKVHTPGGTVTDLGTEFGVYVKTGPEIPESNDPLEQTEPTGAQQEGKEPPTTEVHVFKGQVQLAQQHQGDNPTKSEISSLKSEILSAGQAVTISDNKVQFLPAADPFKFALDKLNGRPRKVLLAEDFESLPLGRIDQPRSGWITAGTTRKGQGIGMIDPVARLAALGAKYPEATDGQLFFGNRVASIAFTGLPPNDPPLLAHEIDGRELSERCQVLIQFDIMSESKDFSVSLAIASAVQSDEKIAFEKKANPSAALTEWPIFQWYRVRLLLDVAESKVHGIRAERLKPAGKEGWVHDRALHTPMPQLDWTTPPRYVVLGMPTSGRGGGGIYWLDNVRMEVLPGK
ncbi:MAG: FecR family protein [Planctomycetes bacterium]|nr:FecR family protein [Planctomycetota bacterium]